MRGDEHQVLSRPCPRPGHLQPLLCRGLRVAARSIHVGGGRVRGRRAPVTGITTAWVASWWGGRRHRLFTVCVFVVLASLDNTAIALMPPLYGVMSTDLGVSEAALGFVTAMAIGTTALSAAVWGYIGDRANRKLLMLVGTAVWVGGVAGTSFAPSFGVLVAAQLLTAVGLGVIASVGFSVVSDLVSPRRRGLAMSFWGLAQGAGTVAGTLLGGVLGAGDWRRPFLLLAVAGLVSAAAYVFAVDISRGASEPQLVPLFEAGGAYEARISPSDVPVLLRRPTNRWLIVQGFTAQFAYGSLVWLPRLFQAKIETQGVDMATATVVGSMFATVFQVGAVLAIVGGWLGDRWQRRDLAGRAKLSMIGVLGAIPFFVALFFLPLPVDLAGGGGSGAFVGAVFASLVTEPAGAATFVIAFVALTLTSADSPNWFALIGDVNLPEHRGTVFGLGNLVNGLGRALGNGLVGVSFGALVARFPPPLNYAIGLAAFQLCFLPTGWAYWRAAKTSPDDIRRIRRTLYERGGRGDELDAPTLR